MVTLHTSTRCWSLCCRAKALILRDYQLLWVLSIGFELMELTFQHMLPNFNECWWDSWILDVAVCNFLGMWAGMKVKAQPCHPLRSIAELAQTILVYIVNTWNVVAPRQELIRYGCYVGQPVARAFYSASDMLACGELGEGADLQFGQGYSRPAAHMHVDFLQTCPLPPADGGVGEGAGLQLERAEPAAEPAGQGQAVAAAVYALLVGRLPVARLLHSAALPPVPRPPHRLPAHGGAQCVSRCPISLRALC